MSRTTKTIGSGITARTTSLWSVDDPEFLELIRDSAGIWNAAIKRSGYFGAETEDMFTQCEAILAAASTPPTDDDDTPADFARRVLRLHGVTKASIAAGDADRSARFGFETGFLYAQAVMKWQWEDHALRGLKLPAAGKEGGEARARMFKPVAEKARREFQRLRSLHPRWTKHRIRTELVKSIGASFRSIETYTRGLK
jgi:hypothetical protein